MVCVHAYLVDCFLVSLDLLFKWPCEISTSAAVLKALELTEGHCTRWPRFLVT